MDKIKLSDVIPAKPEFFVTKKGRHYKIRPPTLQDQIWMADTFKNPQALMNMIHDRDWRSICKFVYHQMDQKGRADFPHGFVSLINEEGKKTRMEMSGPDLLLSSINTEDGLSILRAINRAIHDSNPVVGQAMEEAAKKKLMELNRKPKGKTQTGRGSSTR